MTEQQIKYMVDRFLAWRFPSNICPDGGIKIHRAASPVGTNLLSAMQAEEMVRHMIKDMPS